MGDKTDPKSRMREERALVVFNSLTHGLDRDLIERIRNSVTSDDDRGFSTVRQAINAWNDFLIVADGVIETPGRMIHMRA
jgi:hypothetical protein